jgi:hypothetical protein
LRGSVCTWEFVEISSPSPPILGINCNNHNLDFFLKLDRDSSLNPTS